MGTRVQIQVQGVVQGVGFRPYVFLMAQRRALRGQIRNNSAGVQIEIQGEANAIEEFIADITSNPPPLSSIESIDRVNDLAPLHYDRFQIVASSAATEKRASISPDIATCSDCLRELFDPSIAAIASRSSTVPTAVRVSRSSKTFLMAQSRSFIRGRISEFYGKPMVVAGFEPLDILQAIYKIVKQCVDGRAEIENQYRRVVSRDGNSKSLEVLCEVFELRDYFEWRGLGSISRSGMRLKPKYAAFDAELRFNVPGLRIADPKACQCGEILKGVKKPWECKVFGTACTPETPVGSCMVSSEGACAAYYNFGRLSKIASRSQAGATV